MFRLRQAWCWDALPQTYRDSAYLSTDKDATDAYFAQFSTDAEDTPQPIPDLSGEVQTTPGSESSLQASLQQQIPVKVRWYLYSEFYRRMPNKEGIVLRPWGQRQVINMRWRVYRTYQLVIQLRKYQHHMQEQVSENQKSYTLLALFPGSPHTCEQYTASYRKLAWAWEEASTLHDFTNIGTGTMKKFGPGRKKKCCTQRKCVKPGRTHTW